MLPKMSISMRQCLSRHQCPFQTSQALHFLLPRNSSQPTRFFSSTQFLHAIRKAARPSSLLKSKPGAATKLSLPATKPIYQSFAESLASKAQPILLYSAPSHTSFMVCCYTAATMCFVQSGVCYVANYLSAPADLSIWVMYLSGAVSLFMAGFGTWLFLGPARIIKTIRAIPKSVKIIGMPALAKGAVAPELQVEVELRKMLPVPFFPSRKIYLRPEELVLPRALVEPMDARLSPEEQRAIRLEQEERQKLEWEYERSHIMTAPMRHMSRAFYGLFINSKRAWSREGFLKVEVKGQIYKLDYLGGWALDRGRALDRLAVVKPSI